MHRVLAVMLCVAATSFGSVAFGKEYPIGKPQEVAGMNVAAVYLQPIEMDPPGMMRAAKEF